MMGRGRMVTTRNSDPVVDTYLELLAKQMRSHPHLIRGLSSLERAEALVAGIEVDPDEDLDLPLT